MHMNRLTCCFIVILGMFLIAGMSHADTRGEIKHYQKTRFMYELGGAELVAPGPTKITFRLRLRATVGLGYSCGHFDPIATIKNGFNDVKNNVEEGGRVLVGALQGAVASLPLYIFQRANPDLAALFKEYKIEYLEKYQVALKTCEQREADILAGDEQPYGDLVKLAQQTGIIDGSEDGEEDVVKAKEATEKKGGCLTYIGGAKAGCEGKPPMRLAEDITKAGYAIQVNLPPRLDITAQMNSAARDTRLMDVLGTADEASAFAVRVLGDVEFASLDKGDGPETIPGHGLNPEIRQTYDDISPAVDRIFNTQGVGELIEDGDYDLIQTAMINLRSGMVIDAARGLGSQERRYFAERIKWEIATAQVMEKAMMLRRLLSSGSQESNIYAISPVQEEAKRIIYRLNKEMEGVLFDMDMRKRLVSQSILKMLDYSAQKSDDPSRQGQK
jgi:integrating conjugative element protein (TIGR03755 family)